MEMLVSTARELLDAATSGAAEAQAELDVSWPDVIALCSVDSAARRELAEFRDSLERIEEDHEGAYWIRVILGVLDSEPFVAIEPATRFGIAGRMSGVVDNFQLQVLLMDAFPAQRRRFGRKSTRVSESAAAVARGEGPQSTEETITGAWNLYDHASFRDGRLPDAADLAAHDHWIWGEGIPGDIPVLDGHRVILLGEPSYVREFGPQRTFAHLPASLAARTLGEDEVARWLARISLRSGAGV
jgi:hypothetical protein